MSKKNGRLPQILAAAAIMTAVYAVPAFAAGWSQENGQWIYLDKNGDRVTESWKKNAAGDHWFYLGSDGYMLVSQRIDDGENSYYVNSSGAMVKNEWRKVEDDSDNEAYTDGTCWYYFGSNGKAVKNTSGKVRLTTINGKKYTFDEEGRMLYGWVSADGTMVTEEGDWETGTYYFGGEDDGAAVMNQWLLLDVDDPEGDDDANGSYWFYFAPNGKKYENTTKKINGRNYQFDERGVAQFKWYSSSPSSASSSNTKYYNQPDQCWRADGWFYTVPTEDLDPEAYNDDEAYWFYADKSGNLAASQIKTINKYKYGFNEKGEMLEGLYILTFDENHKIDSYEKIEDISDLPGEGDDRKVYYFGNDPKDGVMATKKSVKIELEDTYEFGFRTNGEAINGISDNVIYIQGRKMKADSSLKYEEVSFGGENYLVNASGVIQKKKTNIKDGDGTYYCTDAKGIVTYRGDEKK